MTDPIWFTGTAMSDDLIDEIREWQHKTNSFVFVDGSLQYLAWNGQHIEPTSRLAPQLTFRLISPSKQVAIHGYRFAYLLAPEHTHADLAWISANICGPASAESIEFAHEAIDAISKRSITPKLIDLAASRFKLLTGEGRIEANPAPSCGYSTFARIEIPLPANYPVLDGRFFDQPGYGSCIKVNLLSPSIHLLLQR
jgi:aspartate/methionine/tyrosine aminotransferase